MKNYFKTVVLTSLLLFGVVVGSSALVSKVAFAADDSAPKNAICPKDATTMPDGSPCIGQFTPKEDPALKKCSGSNCNLIITKYLNPFINFTAGIVGLIVTISFVGRSIQYATAADDPSKVAAAKRGIGNTIFAFVAFLFLYVFLQWLVPGGFLNS